MLLKNSKICCKIYTFYYGGRIMKKSLSICIICLFIISIVLCGCDNKGTADYIVNSGDNITIGVIVSSDEDKGVYSGITYAAELANSVNLDKTYNIETKVALSSADMSKTAADFASSSVAAVICEGNDKETTDAIISAFSEYKTPIIFTDCYSEMIEKSDNAFSISVPYSYQVSAVVSHLISQGLSKGAFVSADDNAYSKDFAKMFESTFTSSKGEAVTAYYYGNEGSNYNANTIVASDYDFVFLAGNHADNTRIHTELVDAGLNTVVFFSEVGDKTLLETKAFNSVHFVSKFESDDNNYIGTDFINTFAKYKNISSSDVTASVAYGYDAYMTVYDSLVSMHKNHESIFNTTEETSDSEDSDIYSSDVTNAIKGITHMGVTDVIRFTDHGTAKTSFVYIDRIDNSHTSMLQRYNYAE